MWIFLTFVLLFHLTIYVLALYAYLTFLDLSKTSDLKEWFDKKN